VLQIQSASLSDPGRKRQNNEDFIASFEPEDPAELNISGCLYIVADGVGGAIKGEKASRYASQKVLFEYYRHPELPTAERLRGFMRQSGNEIFNYAQENHESRMATTMVVAAIKADTLTIANVGDSRAYLFRGENIKQITRDHSLAGEMIREGLMSEKESHNSKVRNLLTRSLGGELDVHPDIFPDIPLLPGDRILLCTDGLTRYAGNDELYELTQRGTPEEVVNKLIDYANHKGGADNISAILIEIGKPASGQEPIILKPNQIQREATDWEDIPTLVGEETVPKKSLVERGKPYIPWGILTIVGILAIAGIVSWKLRLFGGTLPQSTLIPSAFASSLTTQTGIKPSAGTVSETAFLSEVLISLTPSLPITPTELKTVTPERILSTLPVSPTIWMTDASIATLLHPFSTITPDTRVCIFKVSNAEKMGMNPYLSVILVDLFNKEYVSSAVYHYYLCNGDPPQKCGYQQDIFSSDHDNIDPSWWIEIPAPVDCKNAGGEFLP
jgi:serine/threonine protein phosphatase PrpC